MATATFKSVIATYQNKIDKMSTNKKLFAKNIDYKIDEEFYNFIFNFKEYLHKTIHKTLYENKTDENENLTRSYIAYLIRKVLPMLEIKIKNYNSIYNNLDKELKNDDSVKISLYNKWLNLYDDIYALISYRSLTHYAHYMEIDDDPSNRVWEYIMDSCMGGIFYYANEMIMKRTIHDLVKQCPTGYGKCLVPETKILTSNGVVELKNINVGDMVFSMKDNEIVERKVLNKWYSRKKQVRITTINGKEIITSQEHRMFTQRGYVCSKDLRIDDYYYSLLSKVELKDHVEELIYKYFVFEKIKSIEFIDEEVEMIDIEVEETHNFIANGLVSHNSKSDCVIITFILGYDRNADILKVVGNPTLISGFFKNVISMMKSDRFVKVFPVFSKYDDRDEMFSNVSNKEATFGLKDSTKPISLKIINKETAIDGGRFMYQFFDDITQSKDSENIKQHAVDIKNYVDCWKKREYDEYSTLRFFTGTAYHNKDFLSYVKNMLCDNKKPIKMYEGRKDWRKFCYSNETRTAIIILVPKIDNIQESEDKWFCTFPQKYKLETAIKNMHNSPRSFWAMEQQEPLPPEAMAFDWHNLQLYSELPKNIVENNCETIMMIDPARKAKNYVCAGIFKKGDDGFWYFTDCFYKKWLMQNCYPEIVKKIIWHKVDDVWYESNTETSMDIILREKLNEKNETKVRIHSIYSYQNKEEKINEMRYDILTKIKFPREDLYHRGTDMGMAMFHITTYNIEKPQNNEYDDSIDMVSMFAKQIQNSNNRNTIIALDRRIFGL